MCILQRATHAQSEQSIIGQTLPGTGSPKSRDFYSNVQIRVAKQNKHFSSNKKGNTDVFKDTTEEPAEMDSGARGVSPGL